MKRLILTLRVSFVTLILLLPLTATVKADDTEVYVSSGSMANILFVFDLSGSMMWTTDDCDTSDMLSCFPDPTLGEKSRYQIMLESLTTVLDKLKGQNNLRIGLSLYGDDHSLVNNDIDTDNATGIRWPIRDISEDANLTDSSITAGTYKTHEMILKLLGDYGQIGAPSIDYFFPGSPWPMITGAVGLVNPGGTAIVDSLYEATLYFRGNKIDTGSGAVAPPTWNGTAYTGGQSYAAHPETYTNNWNSSQATYKSPISDSCDNNYIVLLSDGSPSTNTVISKVTSIVGSCADPAATSPFEGKCGPELVAYLHNNNLQAGVGILPSNVTTNTIGFAVEGAGKSYLQNLAHEGGGDFYPANDATSLIESLTSLLTTIAGENESFSGFSTSVNAGTLSSGNRVFMNMFKPSADRSWIGNTKGYFIDPIKGLTDLSGAAAIDPVTGQFYDDAQSFWSASNDGNNVDQGGLSGKLNSVTRKIFTYADSGSPVTYPVDRTLTRELASDFNKAWFDVASDAEKNTLITQLKNAPMGDAIHANTVSLSYPGGKKVLFTMTNQGLLHAFDVTNPVITGDTTGGSEIFAFIPHSLLDDIKDHMDTINASDHLYGLDGSISYWHQDADNDGTVDSGEQAYLYFGMRRGGNQYFALDISDLASPELAWRIDGGASAGFSTLGQTWSRPLITTIRWGGSGGRKVIIFGGGYDVTQDGKSVRSADSVGNGVYIVDAITGALLWSAGVDASHTNTVAEMQYSIPSDLTVIHTDDDRQADRIYFGDMGGQVWRIDLPSSGSPDVFRLADFADGTTANFRRFYSSPSVALIKDGSDFQYAVTIGSGYRAHPTTTGVNDRFYLINDTNLDSDGSASGSWSMLSESNLYDTTLNLINEGTDGSGGTKATAKEALNSANGWYLKLTQNGEKSLSPALIFNNQLVFTTYAPSVSASVCGGDAGSGHLYLINLKDTSPIKDFIADTNLIAEDRSKALPGGGIPGTPISYFPPGEGHMDVYVDKQKVFDLDNIMHRINWKMIE